MRARDRQKVVAIRVPTDRVITPSRTFRNMAVLLTFLDQLYAGEREQLLKMACFHFGYRLEQK